VPYHPELAATLEAYAAVLRGRDPADPAAAEMQARAESIREQHAQQDRPD
jgi:hypothetical protein